MVVGPVQVLTRCHDKYVIHIKSLVYGEESIIGFAADVNSLYLYCSGHLMPCSKDLLVINVKSFDQKRTPKFSKDVLKEKVSGFAHVNKAVSDELYNKFTEIGLLFIVQGIPDSNILRK